MVNFNFLRKELKKELTDLFGRGVDTKKVLSYWDRIVKKSKKQAKEIKEEGLTSGIYQEGDIGVYMAQEWEDVNAVRLLDEGKLKSKEFYQGTISGILVRHKLDSDGWMNHYKSPIAYCVSQLEKLKYSRQNRRK